MLNKYVGLSGEPVQIDYKHAMSYSNRYKYSCAKRIFFTLQISAI